MSIDQNFISATCCLCGDVDYSPVAYDDPRFKAYLDGQLVQDVFPALSAEEREVLIGARTGIYICNGHDHVWGDE